jgi:hypothetical protein
MEIVVLAFLLVVGPLALRSGADSRLDEVEHARRWRRIS